MGGFAMEAQSSLRPRRTTMALVKGADSMGLRASKPNKPVNEARRKAPRPSKPPPPSPPQPPKPQGPRVPNFRGMTMRAVLAEAAAKGLSILPDGSGVARVQSPPPGTPLHQGERIRVQFAR